MPMLIRRTTVDELSMIRELLDEPAPSAEVVEEGRKRLLSESARAAAKKRRINLWRGAGVCLTGAAAATALALATLGSGSGGASSSATPGRAASAGSASARGVLLAASLQAASASAEGTYWHVRSMSESTLPQRFGGGDNRYTLEQQSVTENWTTNAGQTWQGRRDWVFPKTAQDEAAWKRDGSPNRWCIGHTDTDPPQPICLASAPGIASLAHIGQDTFVISESQKLTYAELQQLPTDADALRAFLTRDAKNALDKSAGDAVVNMNVEEELANLLVDVPVSPAVRAAAFRALAEMPDVASIGPTKDALGRSGLGIEIKDPGVAVLVGDGSAVSARAGSLTRTLIIDRDTSQILSDQTTVGHDSKPTIDKLILAIGWTNQSPQEPTMPGAAARAEDTSST
jgi:hypothetical protein